MPLMKWSFDSGYPFNNDDMRCFKAMLTKMRGKSEKQARDAVGKVIRRSMLRDYAYRVMFKGHKYPEGHKRPSDTLPVWVDPDD